MVVHGLNFKLKVKVLNQSKKVIMGNFCFSESCIYRNMLGKDKVRSQVWHLQFDGRVPSGGSIQQEAVHMCLAPRESQQTHYELWLQGKHQEWEDSAKTAETKKTARPRRSESEGLTCIWRQRNLSQTQTCTHQKRQQSHHSSVLEDKGGGNSWRRTLT